MVTNMQDSNNETNNRYFLMRHGESLANRRGLIVSKSENALDHYGLTTKGAQQVLQAAVNTRLSRNTIIVTSDYKRAYETAEIMHSVIDCEYELRIESRLRERDFGKWELQSHDNYQSIWQHDLVKPEKPWMGVESVDDTLARIQSVITDLEKEHGSKTILLVGHGDLLQILLAHQNGVNPRFHRSLQSLNNADIRSLINPDVLAKTPAA